MANANHGDLAPGTASGVHVAQRWTAATEAARLVLSVAAADVGGLCWQSDTKELYVLADTTPTWKAVTAVQPVALTDGATITINAALGNVFKVTLAGNRALAAPTNPVDGKTITVAITQDATGSRTLTLATGAGGFAFGTDAPSGSYALSTTAALTDYLTAIYSSAAARWHVVGLIRGF